MMMLAVTLGVIGAGPLRMKPIGAYCADCEETTPFLWNGTLHTVEHHSSFRIRKQALPGCVGAACDNRMVIENIPATDKVSFVSALVVDKTLWLFGTNDAEGPGGAYHARTQVRTFWSATPEVASSWRTALVMQLPTKGDKLNSAIPWYTAFNTSPHKGTLDSKPVYALAIELGSPDPLIGVATRRRDCHSAAPPSTFSRRTNRDGEGVSAK